MPNIILGQKSGTFYQSGGGINIQVKKESNYKPSKIFHRFVHEPKQPAGSFELGPIKIYEGIYDFRRCLTLKNENGYSNAKLECVHVYFNQYEDKTPLLFVLHFKNGQPPAENKYYPRSKFDSEISRGDTKNISDLTEYKDENSILCDLIKETDTILEPITYNIMKKPGDNGGKYNNNKIKVEDDSSDQQLKTAGFTRYKHTPSSSGRGKKACLIYRGDALLKDGKEVAGIQGQEYGRIRVYFGTKAKRTGTGDSSNGVEDVPLLIELVKKDPSGRAGDTDYYVHKRNGQGKYYWEKLQDGISSILEDIGLNTDSRKKGYDILQPMLRKASIFGGGEGDLSGQLQRATGSRLQSLLLQQVNGGKSLLQCLLERVQFNIVDSVVILMDKDTDKQYGDGDIGRAISGLEPNGRGNRINRVKLNGDNGKIKVNDDTGTSGSCIQEYKYKVVQHDLGTLVNQDLKPPTQTAGIRFLIPTKGGASSSNGSKYRELSLYSTGVSTGTSTSDTGPQNLEYKYYTKNGGAGEGTGDNSNKVYVCFYNGEGTGETNNVDPRPLLLCYQNQAYVPRTKDTYFTEWVKVKGVKNCVCPPPDRGDTLDPPVLKALTKVVGFLNEVDLSKHPGTCDGTSPDPPTNTCTDKNGQSCTYEVHQFQGKKVQVKVECCPVPSKPPTNGSCYKKLVHTPAGSDGKGDGFRLGNVKYNLSGGSRKGSIEYYGGTSGGATESSEHKYKPLQKVTAYFYNEDKQYKDPLLVELEFKANGGGAVISGDKEYYKLQPSSDGSKLEWSKDGTASSAVGGNGAQLTKHLDEIRYSLKKVLKVELHHNNKSSYNAMGRKGSDSNGFSPLNGNKKITVSDCKNCDELKKNNYICLQHKLDQALTGIHDQIGGIKLTIPGEKGKGDVEIPLFKKGVGGDGSNNGAGNDGGTTEYEPIKPLTYNKCMGDIYVYFYGSGGSDGTPDSVPLMLVYNNNYYRPETRDQYFRKWIPVDGLGDVKPGEGCGVDQGANLVSKLDEVNRELNRIDLDPEKSKMDSGQSMSYGIPTDTAARNLDKFKFPNERIKLTEKRPATSSASSAYTKIVHRTKNGFEIGDIKYKGSEIVAGGITPNGGNPIKVKKGENSGQNGNDNHKKSVTGNGWNTVVAYYSTTDTHKKLPQLIVILKTDKEVSGDGTPVKGSGTQYGYYIITDEGGKNYEYKWVEVTEPTPVTLNDQTDFKLLNSVVILLEKRGTSGGTSGSYGESEIKGAIGTAIKQESITASPGNKDDVNRLTGKTITLNDESKQAAYLAKTGFKLITHDITSLVDLNQSLSKTLHDVKLIGGLRFLIPTRDKDSYKQLTMKDNGEPGSASGGLILYHQPNTRGVGTENNKVCVFFYQGSASEGDPRPLLMCYANQGYAPKDLKCYFDEWVKDKEVTDCKCDKSGEGTQVLEALVKVSNFLNPVKLNEVNGDKSKNYEIHQFNGQKIQISLLVKKGENGFCYDKYTHIHYGACNGSTGFISTGFRLGNIMYKDQCIKETNSGDSTSSGTCITSVLNGKPDNKYKSADKVVVFYYKHDKDHENPLMVVLCGSEENRCKPYYTLKQKGKKDYEKKTQQLDLSNNKKLGDELDKVLFRNNKKLQVILDQRPMPQLYSPKGKQTEELSKCNFSDNDELQAKLEKIRNDKLDALKDPYCSENNTNNNNDNCKKVDEEQRKKIEEQKKMIEEEIKKLSESFFYHIPEKMCYEAQLYPPTEDKPVSNGKGTTHYNIGVEEMKCTQLTSKGYRCYQHLLTEVKGIEEVGGLKLFLWANGKGAKTTENGGKEIELHSEAGFENLDVDLCGETEKIEKITYNTCKGNLYVYFYGEDPRPLMLCYDGKGYKPKCKAEYEVKWVCVPDVSNCVCGEPEFDATNVLTQLYQLSMELNEVQLGETKSAYTHLQAEEQKLKKEPKDPKKVKPYTYEVHEYNGKQVNVTVTGTDLSCYKQYTHRPEKGYRLGNICYNPDQSSATESPPSPPGGNGKCNQDHGINYSSYKQLISVSLYYYMYDRAHNWPLIVELGYKGELSDFFRLNDPGNTGSGGGDSTDKKWEKMDGNTGSCTNNGAPSPPSPNGQTEEIKNTCDLDKEFARTAAELQRSIYESERGIPWDHNRYWYRVVDLEELIERRAYRIRKSLEKSNKDFKYTKDEKNLILKTDKDCHEESVMGYVIGGGAVGVAGGGGWKAVSVM